MEITKGIVLKSLMWKYLERCGIQGITFIVSIVLARHIAPKEFGIIAIVMILIELSNVVVEGGFNSALIQKKNPTNSDYSTILYLGIFIASLIYLLFFIIAPYIAKFYSEPRLTIVLRVLGSVLIVKAFNSVQSAYISKNMLFKKSFFCSLFAIVISGVVGIVMAYKKYGIWSLVAQQMLSQFGICFMMWLIVRWRPNLIFSKESLKELFDFGWKIFASNALVAIFKNIRGLLVGKVFGAPDLAFFERGRLFPNVIIENICATIQAILFPVLSNKQDDKVAVKNVLRRSIKTTNLFVTPILIGLAVMAPTVVVLLLTDKWTFAIPFVQIFCLAYLIMPIQTANMQVIAALGKSDTLLRIEVWKKVLEVSILLISLTFGVVAVAWGTVIYNIICLFINLNPNRKLINYGYIEQLRDIIPIWIVSILMGCLMWSCTLFLQSMWQLLISQMVLGLISFLIMCFIFRVEAFNYVWIMVVNKLNIRRIG